jgi:hypothetical protein
MAKERVHKRQAWNKGFQVGKRDGFTPDQVKQIRGLLADRGVRGLRDLALFSAAIDTMPHGQNLLSLVAGDVQRRDGSIRTVIEVARARRIADILTPTLRANSGLGIVLATDTICRVLTAPYGLFSPRCFSGLRKPIAIQAAISFNIKLPE